MREFSGISRFPVGFWNYMQMQDLNEQALHDWEEAGFSCIMSPRYAIEAERDMQKLSMLLDWCEKRGVSIILQDPRVAITQLRHAERGADGKIALPDDYAHGVAEAIEQYAVHPQVVGFFVVDEPEWDMYDAVVEAVRIVKQHNARLLPFVNLLPLHPQFSERLQFESYAAYLADYAERAATGHVCYDYYAQMSEREYENPLYFVNLNYYSGLASTHGVGFWNTLLATPHFCYRKPSYDDFRWQVNTTLAYGAKGILYFTFYTPENGPGGETNYRQGPIDWWGNRTESFAWIRDVNRELHGRWGDMFLSLELVRVGHYPQAPAAELTVFRPDGYVCDIGIVTGRDPHLIVSEFRHRDNGTAYVFVVNANPRDSAHVRLHVREVSGAWRFDAYGERHAAANSASTDSEQVWKLWLAPGQGELLALEPKPETAAQKPAERELAREEQA